ncbi:hypothetical protein [Pedobacter cryophilus]|uniref:Uncharacterized protein n=1 Tax=Pedobacter cryophilus TaxID=2571271 RepID=A0A4U1BXL8_9SPHI|nr:hypothetical protein [Pedobacter cryophilus]TKB97772.1 hypothetical protein FA046_10445 [Pedobacter cryophilus]
MKKLTAILFLIIYLVSTTEVSQFLKLNVFFEHFSEHKSQDKDISLIAFFDMHYLNGNPRDKDYDRDMQLPFKTSSDNISIINNHFVPLTPTFSIKNPIEILKKKNYIRLNQSSISTYLSNIWQPPKTV